jgi:uridylate kinase
VRRVLLKLSGEAFLGHQKAGIDLGALFQIAHEIKKAGSRSVQIAVVVGGGNIWRGAREQGKKLERVTSDNMGMLATIINALALQDALEQIGTPTRVLSALEISKVAEPYIRRRAIRHLEKGRVLIFAAGTGNPFFSTDTAAALRATEIGADVLLKATHVDGVYSADPRHHPQAKRFQTLSLLDAIKKRLGIMDTSALSLCLDNNLPVRVFNLHRSGNITRSLRGKKVGTILEPEMNHTS